MIIQNRNTVGSDSLYDLLKEKERTESDVDVRSLFPDQNLNQSANKHVQYSQGSLETSKFEEVAFRSLKIGTDSIWEVME